MWQVLVAAAVGGSGLLAKRLFNWGDEDSTLDAVPEQARRRVRVTRSALVEDSIPVNLSHTRDPVAGQDSIFRFSSKESSIQSRAPSGGKKSRRGKGNAEGVKKGFEVQRLQRRFSICLKKRKTGKNASVKCGPRCSTESSFFSWGLGVGIMYMMSAGNSEISKLNASVDETAKVVQELKADVYKRKSSGNAQILSSGNKSIGNAEKTEGKYIQPVAIRSSTRGVSPNDVEDSILTATDDGEYASSVLTEEPAPEMMEMDQMEAELESEFLKLPGCFAEDCDRSGMTSSGVCETEVLAEGYYEAEAQISKSHQLNGVLPSELDQKLCHLLIEQQESQLVELESELSVSQSKLREKEAELQVLKDCVKRLSEFSLTSVSDNEIEDYVAQEGANDSNKFLVGMKRGIDSMNRAVIT